MPHPNPGIIFFALKAPKDSHIPLSLPPSLENHSYGSRKEEGGDSSCYARQHICSSLSNPWNLLELRYWSILSGMQEAAGLVEGMPVLKVRDLKTCLGELVQMFWLSAEGTECMRIPW